MNDRINQNHSSGKLGSVLLRPLMHDKSRARYLFSLECEGEPSNGLIFVSAAAYRLFLFSLVTLENVAVPGFRTRRLNHSQMIQDYPRSDDSAFDSAFELWELQCAGRADSLSGLSHALWHYLNFRRGSGDCQTIELNETSRFVESYASVNL